MRLRELKCENCGAMIKVEENASQVKCDFCQTTFAVEDAYSDGYKFEKGRMKAQDEQLEKNMEQVKNMISPFPNFFATKYIVSAIIGFAAIIMIFILINYFGTRNSNSIDKFDISLFNSNYESYIGTEYGSSVGRLIDEASTNNKKDKNHQIIIKYKDIETKEPEKMKEIKKQLDEWSKYEVSFEYNKDGFIYLATIEE